MYEFVEREMARVHAHGLFNISVNFDDLLTVHLSPEVKTSLSYPCRARLSTFAS